MHHLVTGYEAVLGAKDATTDSRHHQQTKSAQITFFEKWRKLSTVLHVMVNHFKEESTDLLMRDTKDIADPTVAEMIPTHCKRGKDQFQSFSEGLQSEDQCSFYQTMKKNKIALFKHEQVASSST